MAWVLVILLAAAVGFLLYRERKRKVEDKMEKRQGLKNLVMKMNKEAFQWFSKVHSGTDFPGAFVIHNSTQDKWLVKYNEHVCEAIWELIHKHPKISKEYKTEHFSFRLLPLEISGFGNPGDLVRALEEVYTGGKLRY